MTVEDEIAELFKNSKLLQVGDRNLFASSLVAYKKTENQVKDRLDDDEYIHQATVNLEHQLL